MSDLEENVTLRKLCIGGDQKGDERDRILYKLCKSISWNKEWKVIKFLICTVEYKFIAALVWDSTWSVSELYCQLKFVLC